MGEGLEVITVKMHNGFMINYSYILFDWSNQNCLVIDPSWEPDEIRKQIEKRNGLLTDVLLTHSHIDHTYSLSYFLQRSTPTVWISKAEAEYYHFHSANLSCFDNLQKIQWNQYSIEAILTPGHTKGSSCFLIENHLFTGDTLFGEGCGICTSPGGSPDEMFESIQFLKSRVKADTLIYPGHSYGLQPGNSYQLVERKNIYLQITNKSDFIYFRNRKGQRGLFDFK